MNDEQLEQIQNNLIQEFEAPIKLEKEILELADKISLDLYKSNKSLIEYNDIKYFFKSRKVNICNKKGIELVVADMDKFKLLYNKYQPYHVTAEIDNNLSDLENYKAIVEAFFRHITGLIKPEEL